MKIHSDTITSADLYRLAPAGTYPENVERVGSRKRNKGLTFTLSAEHGTDAHGIKRAFARNPGTGNRPPADQDRAATWVEYGDLILELFRIDPAAIIGPYPNLQTFITETTRAAEWRPKREHAAEHAARWEREGQEIATAYESLSLTIAALSS